MKGRLLEGSYVMIVAAAHWNIDKKRFNVVRPPRDWLSGLGIDSGGFTAARRWGKYPWSLTQYCDFIGDMSRDIQLDFCAIMDYACERGVNREVYETNIDRIKSTIENEVALVNLQPALPWLAVYQGDTLEERAYDLAYRKANSIPHYKYYGIGSVCGRGAKGAIQAVRFYIDQFAQTTYHCFGMHIQALNDPYVRRGIRSWDSYGWAWGRGKTDVHRPAAYFQHGNENYSVYTKRLALLYWINTIVPKLRDYNQ